MPPLPTVSGRQLVAAFHRADFEILRRGGSHIIIVHADFPVMLSVPDRPRLKPGIPRALMRKAGLTARQFKELLE
jgi:predicted RNA binding protein YcfA (HicA-like mRNA interferase family)